MLVYPGVKVVFCVHNGRQRDVSYGGTIDRGGKDRRGAGMSKKMVWRCGMRIEVIE